MKRGSAPTMKDVAREAGVALGTVSKVFNNGSVGEEYRQRAVVKHLGYGAKRHARLPGHIFHCRSGTPFHLYHRLC